MKYLLNPNFENKNDNSKIEYLRAIMYDIQLKIDEIENKIILNKNNEIKNKIEKKLIKYFNENINDEIEKNYMIKKAKNFIVNNYYFIINHNNMYQLDIILTFTIHKLQYTLFCSEIKNKYAIKNNYFWMHNNCEINVKDINSKLFTNLDNYLQLNLKKNLYNLLEFN
jgi:hypothetical protein